MIAGWTDSTQRGWLLMLVALWAVLLFGSMIVGRWDENESNRSPLWARIASSVVLVVAAWSGVAFVREGDSGRYALFIALGMTMGLIGDLFMAKLIPMENHVLGGIGAFGIGHVFYITAFLQLADSRGWAAPQIRWSALVVWLLIGLVLWYLVVFRPAGERTVLHIAALPYALLLAATTGFATGLAIQATDFFPLAVGAALFLISDLLLAAGLFNGLQFKGIGDVIWATYGLAQMLIVYSLGVALSG